VMRCSGGDWDLRDPLVELSIVVWLVGIVEVFG